MCVWTKRKRWGIEYICACHKLIQYTLGHHCIFDVIRHDRMIIKIYKCKLCQLLFQFLLNCLKSLWVCLIFLILYFGSPLPPSSVHDTWEMCSRKTRQYFDCRSITNKLVFLGKALINLLPRNLLEGVFIFSTSSHSFHLHYSVRVCMCVCRQSWYVYIWFLTYGW